jgi:polyphosphate kinase 2
MKTKNKHQHAGGEVTELAREAAKAEQYWIVGDRSEPRKPPKNYNYVEELIHLQIELIKLQEYVRHNRLKMCVIFEGRDAAGKGGIIKRITDPLNPRVCRVVALATPTERERGQWYFQRYVAELPSAGEIVLFDRSWYNRAGVERVMGFCTPEQTDRFLKITPLVERAIIESGIILLKYWLEVSPEEQTRRLKSRFEDGRKVWKLSPMDLKSYSRWYDYSRARDAMFAATDTSFAPWRVAPSDRKKSVRLNIISDILKRVPYKELPRDKLKLPPRQKAGDYVDPDHLRKIIEQRY